MSSAPTLAADNYAPVFYWSIIETNVGVLSACLPTLRPLYKGYRLDTWVSRFSFTFSTSRSTNRLADSIRLNSVEHGFNDYDNKAMPRLGHETYAVNGDSESLVQRPRAI